MFSWPTPRLLDRLVALWMPGNSRLSAEGPLRLGRRGRLRSVWWSLYDRSEDLALRDRIDATFGPGVFDFDRGWDDWG